jgi:hypothetical protein
MVKIVLRNAGWKTLVVPGYVAVVLALDLLAWQGRTGPLDWTFLRWRLANGVDLFKFVAWFLVPFCFSLSKMDWGYWGVRRWKRADGYLLVGLIAAGLVAVVATQWIPALRAAFPSYGQTAWSARLALAQEELLWTFSWIIGWEFMHRYALLRWVQGRAPRFGWLLIPAYEAAYHLNWPTLWMPAAMAAFSLVMTPWARKRQNTLLPFLAHLIVEVELVLFQILSYSK